MAKPVKLIVNSNESLSSAIGKMRTLWSKHKYLRITIAAGKDRSSQINALGHAWYSEISQARGEMTPGQVKALCKLQFGVPILRRDDEGFREDYDFHIKKLDYERKLFIISMVPVTSLMTSTQHVEYLEEVKAHFEALPTDPVYLEWPSELADN